MFNLWALEDEQIVYELNQKLTSYILVYYNHSLALAITSVASNKGAVAVISYKKSNGQMRSIDFASQKFTGVKLRYSTIEKDSLVVKEIHDYEYGRCFTLLIDHKPLERIFRKN